MISPCPAPEATTGGMHESVRFRPQPAPVERRGVRLRGDCAARIAPDGNWLFTDPIGQVLNPRTDTKHWKDLLHDADVRDARLHDVRHTAATVLLILGVPERAVMEIMGLVALGDGHALPASHWAVRDDIAGRVGGLLWGLCRK